MVEIKEQLNVIKYKNRLEMVKDLTMEFELKELPKEWLDYLEEECPDSSFNLDVNLEVLMEYFIEGGFSEEEVINMNKVRYGLFIEVYYLEEEELYVLEYGVR